MCTRYFMVTTFIICITGVTNLYMWSVDGRYVINILALNESGLTNRNQNKL